MRFFYEVRFKTYCSYSNFKSIVQYHRTISGRYVRYANGCLVDLLKVGSFLLLKKTYIQYIQNDKLSKIKKHCYSISVDPNMNSRASISEPLSMKKSEV